MSQIDFRFDKLEYRFSSRLNNISLLTNSMMSGRRTLTFRTTKLAPTCRSGHEILRSFPSRRIPI